MRAYLSLDGIGTFPGRFLGWPGGCSGEAVRFRSPLFAPQILTDPSFYRKIVVVETDMADDRWPMPEDCQSFMPHLSGLVILGRIKPSFRETHFTLRNYLECNRITGFVPDDSERLKSAFNMVWHAQAAVERERERSMTLVARQIERSDIDLRAISSPQEYLWDLAGSDVPAENVNLIVWDFGMNYSLMRALKKLGCKLRVMPPDTEPERIIALHPDGVVIAGGPLDEKMMPAFASRLERIVGIRPLLGVGTGALVLARGVGARLEPLDNPHYGSAIEVENAGGKIFATYQVHSVVPNRDELQKAGAVITHINRVDGSVEAFAIPDYSTMGAMFPISIEPVPEYLTEFVTTLKSRVHQN
jgi:carbamoyl-phosphate synthase small subunit